MADPDNIRIVAKGDRGAVELLLGDGNFGRRYQNFLKHYPDIQKQSPGVKTGTNPAEAAQTSAVFAAFQTASGDTHPIHYDVEYCRARGMPDLLAHGFQTLVHTAPGAGLFPYLVEESLVGFLEQSSKFLKPVYAGDTIYPALEVTDLVPAEFVFGGKCSTLATNDALDRPPDPIRKVQARMADRSATWPELCAAARQGRRLLRDAGRVAELYELMQQWHAAAADEEDRAVLDESAREQIWIVETWGRGEEARFLEYDRASRFDDQMMLPFA